MLTKCSTFALQGAWCTTLVLYFRLNFTEVGKKRKSVQI